VNHRSVHPCPEHASASGRDQVAGWCLIVLMMAGLAGAAPCVEDMRNETSQLHAGNATQQETRSASNSRC
jgi:hypothetical protein